MNQPHSPDTTGPGDDGPRMLPTVDPSSEIGHVLNDSVARLRFANVDREVRDMAQDILDGKASARDLLSLPEFQPFLEAGRKQLQADIAAMTDEEREAMFGPGRTEGPRSAAAGKGERTWDA